MIKIFHGTDQVSSRRAFTNQKTTDSLTFDAINLDLAEAGQSMSEGDLFGLTKKVFIENLYNKKALKNYESIIQLIKTKSKNVEVFLWSDKEIGKKLISELPDPLDQNFKIPQNIFGFLDAIRPKNSQNVTSFHETLKTSEIEIVFFMLIRQFRLLLSVIDSDSSIDEAKRLAPWQKTKLARQASLFGEESLKTIFKKIYKIDKTTKTGRANLNLVQNIDILLLEI